jgi:hypothetical protein
MSAWYDVLLGLTLFAIGGLGVCIGYAIAQRDRRADLFFVDDPQPAFPEYDVQPVDPRTQNFRTPTTYSTTVTYPLNKAQYEAELDKPNHVPGEYQR